MFADMRRLLDRIRLDEDMQASMSIDMARELDEVLERAVSVPFFV